MKKRLVPSTMLILWSALYGLAGTAITTLSAPIEVSGRLKPPPPADFERAASATLPEPGSSRPQQTPVLSPLTSDASAVLQSPPPAAGEGAKGRLQIGVVRQLEQPVVVNRQTVPPAQWTRLSSGWRVWSVEVTSAGAVGLRAHLESVELPPGARFVVYDPARAHASASPIGPEHISRARDAWAATIFAEKVVVECQVPPAADTGAVAFRLEGVSHLFQLPTAKALKEGPCHNDVTCYPAWADQADGVALISFVDSGVEYVCTGCLLNTTETNAFVDYFLTAHHCVDRQAVADTLEVFWFFQTSACNGVPPDIFSVPYTSGGADFLAGSSRNDFAFLRLRQEPPAGVFFLGWSTAPPATSETVAVIHHPDGSYKRISFGNRVAAQPNFWQVQWNSGVTEPGSSGAPLMNANHQVIGQLYGGESSCNNLRGVDTFGRFDVTYNSISQFIDPRKGAYAGLFQATNGVGPESSGSFSFKITPKRAFSGKLQLGTPHYSMRGTFASDGSAGARIARHNLSPLTVTLQLDLSNGTGQVTGTVSDGTWTAALLGYRAAFDGKSAIAPELGKYTMLVPGGTNAAATPGGDGYATVSVDKTGRVKVAGALADGTRFTQSSVVSRDGQWPLYVPLYRGTGLALSWMDFANGASAVFSGNLTWMKPAAPAAKYYPGGFTNHPAAWGLAYLPQPRGTTALDAPNADLVLSGGNLSGTVSNTVVLGVGKASSPGNPKVSLSFNLSSGLFSGRVPNPAGPKPIALNGVVLQASNYASGFFLGTSQSGHVLLAP